MDSTIYFKKMVDPTATKICRVLSEANHEAYLVGGCVRDMLMKLKPKDWDIATSALPEEVDALFEKTIPTGLKHGTISVILNNELFEVTTFRTEGKYADGRRPESVTFVKDIVQDLGRRDLTINAMAYDPIKDKMIDPFNGKTALKNKVITAVGEPIDRFEEDGLRVLRAIRFAARFGYIIDDKTFYAMCSNIDTLRKVSVERIKDELSKILMTDHMSDGIRMLHQCGAMNIVSPLLVFNEVLSCQGDLETKLAHLYREYTPKSVEEELTNLKFSNKEIKRVMFLLNLKPLYKEFIQEGDAQAYINFMAHIKNDSLDDWQYTFQQFMHWCKAYNIYGKLHMTLFNTFKDIEVPARKELQINGDDLINMGMKAGPEIKKILDMCYLIILKNPEKNNKETLFLKVKDISK